MDVSAHYFDRNSSINNIGQHTKEEIKNIYTVTKLVIDF